MITKTYSIKLSDFDEARVMSDYTEVNRAIALSTDGTQSFEWWIVQKKSDASETIVLKDTAVYMMAHSAANPICPARIETFVDDDIEKAKSKALNLLEKNRYHGSVEISLDAPLAKELRDASPWCQALIYGYNSADDSTFKKLPLMWMSENQSGQKKACFGRLDDYYYI